MRGLLEAVSFKKVTESMDSEEELRIGIPIPDPFPQSWDSGLGDFKSRDEEGRDYGIPAE